MPSSYFYKRRKGKRKQKLCTLYVFILCVESEPPLQQNGNEQQSQRYERRKRQKGKEEEEGEEGEEGEERKEEKREGGREGEEEEEDEERRGRRNDDDDDDDDDAKCQNRWRFRLGEERCPIPKEVLHTL